MQPATPRRPSRSGRGWVDSLNVGDGETYAVVFLADDPGIGMGPWHHLDHAAEGLVAELAYDVVRASYEIGGPAEDQPE